MAAGWLGSVVSIDCGPSLGVYQGKVSSVDQVRQTISLRQSYHNGVRCPVPEVTFSATDIKELKFLDVQSTANRTGVGVETEPTSIGSGHSGQNNRSAYPANNTHPSTTPVTILRRAPAGSSNTRGLARATSKKNGVKTSSAGGQMRPKDECFGDGTDEGLDTDFDFEGNLALFDKAAVFSQIDGNRTRPCSTPSERTPPCYRHDENILEGKPVVYRQITVPQHGGKEYCTDNSDKRGKRIFRDGNKKKKEGGSQGNGRFALRPGGPQRDLRPLQTSAGGSRASRPVSGAQAGDDGGVRQSDGPHSARWAQQAHPQERPPEAHGGPAVWAPRPGGPGHQLWATPGQPRGGGHPVSAQLRQDAGVCHQRAQPLQQDQRHAGGQRQRPT